MTSSMVERFAYNENVSGSSPLSSSTFPYYRKILNLWPPCHKTFKNKNKIIMRKIRFKDISKLDRYLLGFALLSVLSYLILPPLKRNYPDEFNLALLYISYYVLLAVISFGGVIIIWTIYYYAFVRLCFYLIRRRRLNAKKFRIFQLSWHGALAFYGYTHLYCSLAKVDFPLFGFYFSVG